MDNRLLDNSKESGKRLHLSKETLWEKDICIEDIRQGIIWSQILDKPRSKNPYFSRKRI